MVYKLEANKINGVAISNDKLLLETDYLLVKIRFIGESVSFIEAPLEDFLDANGDRFTTIDSLISYFDTNFTTTDLLKVVIVVSGYIYTGIAPIGSLQSAAVWKVKRTTDATPYTTTWAGSGNFNQIMANYASLIYA